MEIDLQIQISKMKLYNNTDLDTAGKEYMIKKIEK